MAMVSCPHCGAQNSDKRQYCYQCEGELHGAPKQTRSYVPTCASCSHAAIYPPPGQRLAPHQVWCMKQNRAVAAETVAGDCFSEAFGWRREEIVD